MYSLCWSSNYTDRISFHNVSFGAANHHDDLSLEGDDQHRALLHHLPHCQLQIKFTARFHMCSQSAAILLECQRQNICYTYINVINVKDFGLETEPECFGLLDRVGQLTVRLRTDQKHEHASNELEEILNKLQFMWTQSQASYKMYHVWQRTTTISIHNACFVKLQNLTHCFIAPVFQYFQLSTDQSLQGRWCWN